MKKFAVLLLPLLVSGCLLLVRGSPALFVKAVCSWCRARWGGRRSSQATGTPVIGFMSSP
jgi:hypothetical protein